MQYERRVPILQQLKVESKLVEEMCKIRAMFNIIRDETLQFGVNAEYGRGKIWRLCVSVLNEDESPYALHLHTLNGRNLLSNLPRNYVVAVERSELYVRTFPILIAGTKTHSIRSGWVRKFFKSTNFRCNILDFYLNLCNAVNLLQWHKNPVVMYH